MINEEQLLEQKALRDQLAGRIDVLEKVNVLFTIPQTEYATVKQVSEFYEVDIKTLEKVTERNKDELVEDGFKVASYKEFLNLQNVGLEMQKGKAIISFDDSQFVVPMRGLKVFPRRAVLRIGMLLRDSEVAKEIRTQLLNIEEKVPLETKVEDINEEQKIMLEVGMAYGTGNADTIMMATAKYMDFKNRHIKMQEEHIVKLKQDNKALAGEILKWEDRSKINYAIRRLAKTVHKGEGFLWNDLYKELKYKHHIDVKMRGDKPWISHIKENEWSKVIQTFSAICDKSKVSPSDIMNNL